MRANRTRLFGTFILLAVLCAPAAADVDEDAFLLASPPGLAEGDYLAVMESAADVIARNPDHAGLIAAAVANLGMARTYAPSHEAVVDRLLALDSTNEGLRRWLRDRLRAFGRFDEAEALDPDEGYLRHWAVVGPFGTNAVSLLDREYGPEREIDFEKGYAETGARRRFLKLELFPGSRTVNPFTVLRPTHGVAYALAQVRSDTARIETMKVVTSGSLRVWLNGDEVHGLRVDHLRSRTGRNHTAPVALRKGWNRVLVKSVGSSRFSLKLPGVVTETDLTLHDPGPAADLMVPAVGDRPAMPIDIAGKLLAGDGRTDQAVEAWLEAVRRRPDAAALRYRLGRAYEAAPSFPEVWRKNRAKAAYQKALEISPEFTPASVALAELLRDDDKAEEAAKVLGEVLEKHPRQLDARMALARLSKDKGWEKEAVEAAEKCLEVEPWFRPALLFLADHHDRYDNLAAARDCLEKVLGKSRADYNVIRRLSGMESRSGNLAAAIARLEESLALWPGHVGTILRIAELEKDAGHPEKALATYRALTKRFPLSPRYPRMIGDVLRETGDTGGALEAYGKSLALDPSQAELRRYADRLMGKDLDFAKPWETEVLDLIPDAPGREEYPRSPAVCLLDSMVTRIWADGSSTDVIHMAYKLLDEKGVEAFGRVSTGGETLEVRTVDAEGRIFEPTGVRRSSYNMPALAPGVVVEYRHRMDTRRDPRWLDTGQFYFADHRFNNAVLLSRWIVILPKDLEVELLQRNFDGKHEVTEQGDTVVHVFEKRNSARIEREPYMPDADDIVPWVRLYRNRPLSDVNYEHLDRLLRDLAPTPTVMKEAQKVVAGIKDPMEMAKALYAHVNDLVTGRYSFGGPTATILEKAGDRFDLYASLLLAAKVPFEMGMACPDRGEDVEWEIVDPGVWRARCIRLEDADGKPQWVFLPNRLMPFGRVPDRYRDSPVLVAGAHGGRVETLPSGRAAEHTIRTSVKVSLAESRGDTMAEVALDYPIDGGYGLKERMKDQDTDERRQQVERILNSYFTGPALEEYDLPAMAEPGVPCRITASAKVPNFLLPEGEELKTGLGIQPMELARSYVGKPERIHPMVIRTERAQMDRAEIDLGGLYEVVSLPEGHVTLGPLGAYSLSVEEVDGVIQVRRDVRFRPARLTQDEYRELVLWVKDIDEAEDRKIILRRK